MAKAIVKTQPLNKASSEIREIATLASWLEFQEGVGKASPILRPQAQGQGHSASKGRAHSGNGFSFLSWGHCTWKNNIDSVISLAKGGSKTGFHYIKHYACCAFYLERYLAIIFISISF